jgi:hypothetical protein
MPSQKEEARASLEPVRTIEGLGEWEVMEGDTPNSQEPQ